MAITLETISVDIAEMKKILLLTKSVFTPTEAAQYMGISRSTLYKLTSSGVIPYSKPNGKLIYFAKASLDEWLLRNNSRSTEQLESDASTYISRTNKGGKTQ